MDIHTTPQHHLRWCKVATFGRLPDSSLRKVRSIEVFLRDDKSSLSKTLECGDKDKLFIFGQEVAYGHRKSLARGQNASSLLSPEQASLAEDFEPKLSNNYTITGLIILYIVVIGWYVYILVRGKNGFEQVPNTPFLC